MSLRRHTREELRVRQAQALRFVPEILGERASLLAARYSFNGDSLHQTLLQSSSSQGCAKVLLLMFVNVMLLAFTPLMVRRGSSSFKRVGETVTVRLNERVT